MSENRNDIERILLKNATDLYDELESYVGGILAYCELDNIAEKYGWQFIGENREGSKMTLIESPMGRQINLMVSIVYDQDEADRIDDVMYVCSVEKKFWYRKEDFPKKAIYRRRKNVIPFATDFKDGEVLEFYDFPLRPNAWKEGLAIYTNGWAYKLVNIIDLEPIEGD